MPKKPELPMHPATLRALRASIAKWETRAEGKRPKNPDCNLCGRFDRINNIKRCKLRSGEKCPVFVKTGHTGCINTPFSDYIRLRDAEVPQSNAHLMSVAKREVRFLRSLLPKGKR